MTISKAAALIALVAMAGCAREQVACGPALAPIGTAAIREAPPPGFAPPSSVVAPNATPVAAATPAAAPALTPAQLRALNPMENRAAVAGR